VSGTMNRDRFPALVLVGRPASGKSEVIDYLRGLDDEERLRRFHIGSLSIIDDFPILWSWFEEDQILSELGKPRLHTDGDGYFLQPYLWDVLVRRLCLEYDKLQAAEPELSQRATIILEFSRGSEHGGYARAFANLSETVAAAACFVYVKVSFDESLRKNRRRFNPAQPHSILEHSLPDDKMERLYREDDWSLLAGGESGTLSLGTHERPYVVFDNRDDVTTTGGELLGKRLEVVLGRLWAARIAGAGAKKRLRENSPGP
jgi:hypothetical protein